MRESLGDRIFGGCVTAMMAVVLLVVMYPLFFVVIASLSDPNLVNTGQVWLWPKGFTLDGYTRVLHTSDIWLGYRNTIFYTIFGTMINLLITLPCAYALSRKDLVGRNVFMGLLVVTMFFSGGIIPTFLIVKDLGLLNTVWAVLLPSAASVFNIIIARTFFISNIPRELEDAANIDGCDNAMLFVRIVLPLSAPIIAVMALFYGVAHWNNYFNAMIYLKDRNIYPLQLFLREILIINQMTESASGSTEAQAAQVRISEIVKYAVIIVSTLPVIVLYPFLQRYFVQGVMVGSIKG